MNRIGRSNFADRAINGFLIKPELNNKEKYVVATNLDSDGNSIINLRIRDVNLGIVFQCGEVNNFETYHLKSEIIKDTKEPIIEVYNLSEISKKAYIVDNDKHK